MRGVYGVGLASCHSTDNYDETCLAINLICNSNSLHHITNSSPDKYIETFNTVNFFKQIIKKTGQDVSDYVLDSSVVMALYGIRDAKDVDYLTVNPDCYYIEQQAKNSSAKSIECHDMEMDYHNKNIQDLVNNPKNYFIFNGVKFLSLRQLLLFKQNRFLKTKDKKDKYDIYLINKFINNNNKYSFDKKYEAIKNNFRRNKYILKRILTDAKWKIVMKLIEFTHKTHTYTPLKKLYHRFK
jgi:hypothetical protein